jgi:uncharacterized damage-inducible protein DinB
MEKITSIHRRDFMKSAASVSAATLGLPTCVWAGSETKPEESSENIIGPTKGFSPHIGTIASMMIWMRSAVLRSLEGLTVEQLDYLHDDKANSIGSMLFHLAATERFYQIHTFEGKKWGNWSDGDKKRFDVAMKLGDAARKTIKGNELKFYLQMLEEVRQNTLNEFKRRDDKWLLTIDKDWFWGPTNNYCKWFHVCEHESNHNGQIKWIKGRLPV